MLILEVVQNGTCEPLTFRKWQLEENIFSVTESLKNEINFNTYLFYMTWILPFSKTVFLQNYQDQSKTFLYSAHEEQTRPEKKLMFWTDDLEQ